MSATAALSAAAVADFATQGQPAYVTLTAALAIVTGLAALVAGLARLGFLAGFISEPVLKGFIVGLALTIVVGQLPKLFGVEKSEGDFFEQLWGLLGSLGDTDGPTLAIGLLSLALVLGLRRFAPVVPGSLVAVAAGVIVVEALDLAHGVAIVGTIDSGLPPVGLPDAPAADYLQLAGERASASPWSGSRRGWARPRPTRRATTTTSTRTASSSGSARPTSAPGWPAAWWSTAASPRPRSTAARARTARSPGSSSPRSPSSPCCSSPGSSRACPRRRSPRSWSRP